MCPPSLAEAGSSARGLPEGEFFPEGGGFRIGVGRRPLDRKLCFVVTAHNPGPAS